MMTRVVSFLLALAATLACLGPGTKAQQGEHTVELVYNYVHAYHLSTNVTTLIVQRIQHYILKCVVFWLTAASQIVGLTFYYQEVVIELLVTSDDVIIQTAILAHSEQ